VSRIGVYLFAAGAFFIVIVCAILAMVVVTKKYKEKIRSKLMKLKTAVFWNSIIKSANISYLPICMTLFAKVSIL
jgi:hypothetical protein